MDNNFGDFIVKKRKEHGLTAKQMAQSLNISAVYMCDIEKNRKISFSDDLLEKMKEILCETERDEEIFYDLIAISRKAVSNDLINYIMENESVRIALRHAKKNSLSDREWIIVVQNYIDNFR